MARTISNDPLMKFRFRITIPGMPSGVGFQKASGLSREVAATEYDEGGYKNTHKLPGREKVEPVVLERGQYASAEMEDYYKRTLENPDMRNTIIIDMLDSTGNVQKTYKLAEAWGSKIEYSDLDAASDDVAIQKLTIQFEYFMD